MVLEKKLGAVYRLYGKAENFRSVIYKDTGHEYLPEMKRRLWRGGHAGQRRCRCRR